MDPAFNYQKILNCMPIGIFTVDLDMNVTFFNKEAESITGYTQAEAMLCRCYEIFRAEFCFEACPLRKAMKSGERQIRTRNKILDKKNREISVDLSAAVLQNDEGRIIGAVESFVESFPQNLVCAIPKRNIRKRHNFHDIVGKDEKISRLFDILNIAAKTDAQILILGETGSGKDLFARAIHNASLRKRGPFVKVNCAALPANLLESEFFGYKKGAFTDAKSDKSGRFQMADGGTILLNEVGDLSPDLQGKLLQVLDENEFYPLGSTEPVQVNVRVISSTNRDLQQMVRDGMFREDLYFRLNLIEIGIPPLRERRSDIPLLIDYFLREQARISKQNPPGISPDAMKVLLNYSYPGNVRELKHFIEHACIMCRGNKIKKDMLPQCIDLTKKKKDSPLASTPTLYAAPTNPLLEKEKELILAALLKHGWSRNQTAKALHMNRTTLWRKMKKLGLTL